MMWFYCDFMAGWVGGACGILIGHPLDTIKTWQQTSNTNVFTAIYQIAARNNGINGYFRGMLFPFITTGAVNSILFGIYGNHLRQLQKICHSDLQREVYQDRNVFAAGSVAGFIQSFIACPIELIKVRLQTHRYYTDYKVTEKKTPFRCMMSIVHTDGFSGLYRGLLPMMCRDVFPYGIYMLAYQKICHFFDSLEYVKKRRQKQKTQKELDNSFEMMLTTVAGAVAGVLSWVLVIPFDVIKTIMQAEEDVSRYKNMKHCLEENIHRYGWRILFRGSWMLVVRAIPVNMATFLGYEYSLQAYYKYVDAKKDWKDGIKMNSTQLK